MYGRGSTRQCRFLPPYGRQEVRLLKNGDCSKQRLPFSLTKSMGGDLVEKNKIEELKRGD